MSKLLVTGKNKLYGETFVQGAKNSALPILAASLLTKGENLIFNCPKLSDVEASCEILRYLGCNVKRYDDTMMSTQQMFTVLIFPMSLCVKREVLLSLWERCLRVWAEQNYRFRVV